ncbi:MAG: hypothetical protein J2P57_02275 [Acidimicrobiaceae bacterium]|nr:hypothetical protein [Acidimicrobiaceae bacterium]
MKILDTLFGRTKAAPADLDRLFALPGAAVNLDVALGLGFANRAGVCVKPAGNEPFEEALNEAIELAKLDHLDNRIVDDRYGYRWAIFSGAGLEDLVTAVHGVNSTLADRALGNQLLCSAFAFTSPKRTLPVLLVYLYKRGTFYPFAPVGGEKRDTETELSIRAAVGVDLPVEAELERWFPLWDNPLMS